MRKITKILTITTPMLALAPLATLGTTNTTSLKLINKETATHTWGSFPVNVTVEDSSYLYSTHLSAQIIGTYYYSTETGTIPTLKANLYIIDDAEKVDGGWDSTAFSLPPLYPESDELQYHSKTTESDAQAYVHINIKRNNTTNQEILNVYVKSSNSLYRTHQSFVLF